MAERAIVELVGIYHADGGLVGELRYVVGKVLGTAHCALCDITHSPVRRKKEWDSMVARLGVPVTLLHLNEMPRDVADVVATSGTPVLLARLSDGDLVALLDAAELDRIDGSVPRTEDAIASAWSEVSSDGQGRRPHGTIAP